MHGYLGSLGLLTMLWFSLRKRNVHNVYTCGIEQYDIVRLAHQQLTDGRASHYIDYRL